MLSLNFFCTSSYAFFIFYLKFVILSFLSLTDQPHYYLLLFKGRRELGHDEGVGIAELLNLLFIKAELLVIFIQFLLDYLLNFHLMHELLRFSLFKRHKT